MKTNQILFNALVVLGIWGFSANIACATTWYVRDGGGSPSQCTGTTNAVYAGSGSNQPCAFSHPRYVLGWGYSSGGQNSPVQSMVMSSGDTLYINGDSDLNPGAQAQYEIGYDDTGRNLTPGCSPSWPYDCTLGNLPAGSSSSVRTSIIGTGVHKPQLWGTQRVWQVLNANNDHLWLQWLEITDHSACAYNDPSSGCNYGGPYPYGQWAEDGLYVGGDDVNLTDVYVHGVARYGMYTDNLASANFTRVDFIGNGYGGVSTGINATISGTLTWNQPIVEWNGCVEAYPISSVDSPSNYSQCFGQNSGGYGDGIAFGNVGHGSAGNWTIIGPGSISFNTQDGLDTLHGNGTGTIQIDKMRFEGNAGNQVKMNAVNAFLTNSVVIGDCGWWLGSPQAYSGFAAGDVCRALGDAVLFNVTNNSNVQILNNTIFSNGNVAVESEDLNGTGCNGSTSVNLKNNIIQGGYAWIDDTNFNGSGGNALTTYIYNDGSDGDGSGTCGNIKWNEDYNLVYGTKNNNQSCVGAHDMCGSNPGFSSTIPMGAAGGAANSYYQGNQAVTLVSLSSSSPAITSGVTGLPFWNNQNDYHNMTRMSPPSKGGMESNSCSADSNGCFYNSDCCTGSCTNFACGASGAKPQPAVSIVNPTDGSSVTAGSNLVVNAAASEPNGTIANVSVYNGPVLLGSSHSSICSFAMNNVAAGNYTFMAQATDNNGISVSSNPVAVTVSMPTPPSLPFVAITSPASASSFKAGSNFTITTVASEINGTIANISLYNGAGVLLGSGKASPFNFVDSNLLAGTYTFTAQATDALGVSVNSAPVTITVTPLPSLPVVSITSPSNGSSFVAGSNVTIQANASETNGTIASVSFYYNGSNLLGVSTSAPYSVYVPDVPQGTYTLTAVATDINGVSVTSLPIIATVNSAPSLPSVSITSPGDGSSFSAGANVTITAQASEINGTISRVVFYNGSTVLGTATSSPYSLTMNNIAAGTYNLTAVVTDSINVTATSSPVSMTVKSAPSLPMVSITSPGDGSSFSAGANVTITAQASEINGTISRVVFYNGSTVLGTATSSPYSLTMNNIAAGTYNITAVVTDALNVTATSSPVSMTVKSAPSLPMVSITSPGDGSSFSAGANVTITAQASEINGTISRVVFYNGSTVLGTATSSPYSLTMNNIAAGSYNLTAVVTDALNVTATSNPVAITVTAPPSLPTVSITSPVNGSIFTAGANVTITAQASEQNGSIANVSFYYNGSNLLGVSNTPPYSLLVPNVPEGVYTVSAVATDANGVTVTSLPVVVTITPVISSLPTVVITSPGNLSQIPSGSNVTITANAFEQNGNITNVSFYYNGVYLLGAKTSAPYSYTVNNVPCGTYTLTAVATDANGVTVTSLPVLVTVTSSSAHHWFWGSKR